MKKQSFITLLAIPFLAACGGSNSNNSLWSSEYTEIMKTNLNNNVLPYIELENATISFDSVKGSVDLTAPSVTSEQSGEYKKRLVADGYTEVVTECLVEQFTSKGFHTYNKSVEGGVLYVDLYCLNSYGSYSTSGEFNVNAYYYDINEEATSPLAWTNIDLRIMTTFLNNQTLLECDVNDKVVTYETYTQTVKVSAPYADAVDVNAYVEKMIDNGYTQVTTGYEDNGFYQTEKVIDANSTLVVQTYTYHNGVNLGVEGSFYIDAFIKTI